MSETTVDAQMESFQDYDFLCNCEQDDDGNWMLLFAPSASPSEETMDQFWDDMDSVLECEDLDHVTEIGNGWFVVKE